MSGLLDAQGKPIPPKPATSTDCPKCCASKKYRRAAGGFGVVAPCCDKCGHVFEGEVWRD